MRRRARVVQQEEAIPHAPWNQLGFNPLSSKMLHLCYVKCCIGPLVQDSVRSGISRMHGASQAENNFSLYRKKQDKSRRKLACEMRYTLHTLHTQFVDLSGSHQGLHYFTSCAKLAQRDLLTVFNMPTTLWPRPLWRHLPIRQNPAQWKRITSPLFEAFCVI